MSKRRVGDPCICGVSRCARKWTCGVRVRLVLAHALACAWSCGCRLSSRRAWLHVLYAVCTAQSCQPSLLTLTNPNPPSSVCSVVCSTVPCTLRPSSLIDASPVTITKRSPLPSNSKASVPDRLSPARTVNSRSAGRVLDPRRRARQKYGSCTRVRHIFVLATSTSRGEPCKHHALQGTGTPCPSASSLVQPCRLVDDVV